MFLFTTLQEHLPLVLMFEIPFNNAYLPFDPSAPSIQSIAQRYDVTFTPKGVRNGIDAQWLIGVNIVMWVRVICTFHTKIIARYWNNRVFIFKKNPFFQRSPIGSLIVVVRGSQNNLSNIQVRIQPYESVYFDEPQALCHIQVSGLHF